MDAHVTNPTPLPPPDEDVFDDDIICEVENYTEGVERDSKVQALNPPQLAFLPCALSSRGACISASDASPSASGATSQNISPRYVWED